MKKMLVRLVLGCFVATLCAFAVVVVTVSARADERAGCRESAFLFSKLTIGSISCDLPASPMLAVFTDTAKHLCGPGPASKWPGSQAGANAMLDELKHDRAGTCARLASELK